MRSASAREHKAAFEAYVRSGESTGLRTLEVKAMSAGTPADGGYLVPDEVEREILLRALERHRYNRTAAGASMGLTLRQMRYRMARLGVQAGDALGERGDD